MFENLLNFFKKIIKDKKTDSKDTAKERLHLVLMQDRANVSADFLELMKQEIIDVIKKYIDVDENSIDVKLTNKSNADGTNGAPILYANIPIISIKDENKNKVIEENKQKQEKEITEDKGEENNQSEENEEKEEKIEEVQESSKENQETEKEVEEKIENQEEIQDKIEENEIKEEETENNNQGEQE